MTSPATHRVLTTGSHSGAEGTPVDLAIVIVSYNTRDLLAACLQSLDDHPFTFGVSAVHVVDNASRDGSPDMVKRDFPLVRLHVLNKNVGFAAANNRVLSEVRARYVLLLNPDTEARSGSLDHMVTLMESDPTIGVSGCRLVKSDGTLDHAAKRSFPTITAAIAHFAKVGRAPGAKSKLAQYRAPEVGEFAVGPVDAVNGAFMLVRREAIAAVGLLDDGYWMYGEDLDWCYRFAQAGWTVVYDGRVEFLHVKGASAGQHRRIKQNAAFHQAMARFYRKYYGGKNLLLDIIVYCGVAGKFLFSALSSALARTAVLVRHATFLPGPGRAR